MMAGLSPSLCPPCILEITLVSNHGSENPPSIACVNRFTTFNTVVVIVKTVMSSKTQGRHDGKGRQGGKRKQGHARGERGKGMQGKDAKKC